MEVDSLALLNYTLSCDVWSLGCILWSLFKGNLSHPWLSRQRSLSLGGSELLKFIAHGIRDAINEDPSFYEPPPPFDNETYKPIWDVVVSMLSLDPSERITMEEAALRLGSLQWPQ